MRFVDITAMKKQKLYSYVKIDDNTPVYKLSMLDQLRVLLRKAFKDDGELLKVEDAKTAETLKLQANLTEFFHKATAPIRDGKERSVTMSVSSRFNPVLNEVLASAKISAYYTSQVNRPKLEFDAPHSVKVKLEVKEH